jgi:hypothetical protein
MTVSRFGAELRAEVTPKGLLVGHAAVFGQVADVGANLEELAASAFTRALADKTTDVRALFNHNPDHLLGRQSSGTLRLGVDSEGLEFEVDLPDTELGRSIRVHAERGDLNGASFAFVPDEDTWSTRDGRRLRTHTSVGRLVDVSPVTFPAYEGAAVALRSWTHDRPASVRARLILARHRARTSGRA